jgi:hypothetical protein
MNLSKLMTAYNFAKWYARKTQAFETTTVDRALGVLMSRNRNEYNTTTSICSCPDSVYRKHTCKHSIALMIERKVEELGK